MPDDPFKTFDLITEVNKVNKKFMKERDELHEKQCQGYRDQISMLQSRIEWYEGFVITLEERREREVALARSVPDWSTGVMSAVPFWGGVSPQTEPFNCSFNLKEEK